MPIVKLFYLCPFINADFGFIALCTSFDICGSVSFREGKHIGNVETNDRWHAVARYMGLFTSGHVMPQ